MQLQGLELCLHLLVHTDHRPLQPIEMLSPKPLHELQVALEPGRDVFHELVVLIPI